MEGLCPCVHEPTCSIVPVSWLVMVSVALHPHGACSEQQVLHDNFVQQGTRNLREMTWYSGR